ncbi:MAG: hypothetical protein NT075_20770 [Chloroflexi bacterium]|nr:hypothetical protein [Chloroflexota bacterium]
MDKNLRLILFAHPRSGSSSLYEMLALHPQLHILEEPFNEGFTSWHPEQPNYLDLITDKASLDAQLAEIFTAYNGIKVLQYQLPVELYTHLLLNPMHKVIFLRRRNLLQAVVSVLIAKQTNLWKRWDMQRPLSAYYADLQPLSIDEIRADIVGLKENLDYYEQVISSRTSDAYLKLIYEDLYFGTGEEQGECLAQIWRFLQVEPLQINELQAYLQPEQAQLNSPATYQFLPNALEIDQQLGNEETGWLL